MPGNNQRAIHFSSSILLALIFFSPSVRAKDDPQLTGRAMRLLQANCLPCHNPEKHKGGLELSTREAALKGAESGLVLVPGKPDQSKLLKVLAADADPHMPPKKQLSTNQLGVVRRWIAAGARWDEGALARAAGPRPVTFEPLPGSYHPVFALALSPDESHLAVGRGNVLAIHDTTTTNFARLAETNAHRDVLRSLAWSTDGRLLASGSFRELKVFDAKTLAVAWSISSNLADRITALQFTPDGKWLIAADGATAQSGWIRILDAQTGGPVAAWQAHGDTIYGISISLDGRRLATAGADKLAKVWQLGSRQELVALEHSAAVYAVAFNSNATELATVCADKQFKIWDLETRESVVSISDKKRPLHALAWAKDGKIAVTADDDGSLFLVSEFKRHSGAQSSDTARERQVGHWNEPLHAVALGKQRLFAGGQDGQVYALGVDGKKLGELPGDTRPTSESREKKAEAPSFVRDVLPAMAKAGCMAGSCHAKPDGQNGFKLSVFSFDPRNDYAEVVKEARGRRVFPAAPAESLLLLKPTMSIEHGGGERFETGSEIYRLIVDWIRGGMIYQHTNEPALAGIGVTPHDRALRKRGSQQLRVVAHYSGGSTRDVTALADYVANDKEIAQVTESGLVRAGVVSGESVVVARYMGFVDAAHITIPADRTLPERSYAKWPADNFIDRLSCAQFRKLGLFPSEACTDSEFLRRSSLDAIGVLPTAEEARAFLADTNANKRLKWIDHLLDHPAYADYWANNWADLLRPNPDRVGVKSIFILDQWLREQFRNNTPYDKFVRSILVLEGSNHRDGPAVIYRDRREPPELTTMFSQLFLGTRMECARCHHHPNEKWSQDDFYHFAAFFGPVKQKGVGLSPPISGGTETFYFAGAGTVVHPLTGRVMQPCPPDGSTSSVATNVDPRRLLADWLTSPENPFFARAAVNRVWAAFFGRGFVQPVDDFRASNPAVNEPLLNALAAHFTDHGCDLKNLMRTIMSSRLYQLSSTPNEFNLGDTRNFSRALRRRLPAEVLLDAVTDLTGVPEDFSGCAPGTRAVQAWSYKVKSQFLDAFGRPNPSSDCPCERDTRTSVVQALHMMNSRALQAKLSSADGNARKLADESLSPEEIVTELYLSALCRFPTAAEMKTAAAAYQAPNATRRTATEDVLWALLNSVEFQFNH